MRTKQIQGIQHGDVLIKRVKVLPDGCKEVQPENGHWILAHGEATGHHHAIIDKGCRVLELKGELYLEVTAEQVTITHEEHRALDIPAGIYQIGRVREHDYFQDMERQVRD